MSTTDNYVEYDRDLMRSCIYGLAVGDALGVPYEFCERGTFECTGMVDGGTHKQYAGTWSDDTSMALCICSSIKRLGRIATADIDDMFNRWLEDGEFTCDGHVFDVYKIRDVSAITHAHPVAEWSCVTPCDILWTIRNSGTPAKWVLWRRYGYIASRPIGAVKKRRLLRAHARSCAPVFHEHGLTCRLRTYCRQLRRRHRYDCGRGRCARRRVLRFRGNPAEVGRPAAWQDSNRPMHLGR